MPDPSWMFIVALCSGANGAFDPERAAVRDAAERDADAERHGIRRRLSSDAEKNDV